jgi:16S rRNA processing protein RimM
MMDQGERELIAVARIARPRGVHGEVIADLLTDFPDRFAPGQRVHLQLSSGEVEVALLDSVRFHQGRAILRLEGADRLEEAERLRSAIVSVTREELVPLPDDTYYDFDLVGCRVESKTGEWIGTVRRVDHYGAAPLLVVDGRPAGRPAELLVPFVALICPEVDLSARRIVVDPPEGLFD